MARLSAVTTAGLLLGAAPLEAQALRGDISLGPEWLSFQATESEQAAVGAKGGAGLVWTLRPGGGVAATIEPRVGVRALKADSVTITELVGNFHARLASGTSRVRWWVSAEQRLRAASDDLPPPVYFEPGRSETWGRAGLAVPGPGGWLLESWAAAGAVRYEPVNWQTLDRTELAGAATLSHTLGPGLLRLTIGAGIAGFEPNPLTQARDDDRWAFAAQWSTRGAPFLQLEAAAGWNSSNIPTFDYRALRTALLLSAPLGRGSLQLYAAVASKTYRLPADSLILIDPGSERETGSFVIAQATRPLSPAIDVRLRAEWLRHETAVRSRFYQRVGAGASLAWRWPGAGR